MKDIFMLALQIALLNSDIAFFAYAFIAQNRSLESELLAASYIFRSSL